MKRILSLVAGLILAGAAVASAQTDPLSNSNYYNHSWSNYVNQSNSYNYLWGTNCLQLTNAPKAWSNYYNHSFEGPAQQGNQERNRFGQQELPADVQTIVAQFQQDRERVMSQLKTASDEQRQDMLKEMELLRTQLREQIQTLREDAQRQAEQMRTRLNNDRDRILNQGAGTSGGGRDR